MTAVSRRLAILLLQVLLLATSGQDLIAFPLDSVLARAQGDLSVTWIPDAANTRSQWYVTNGSKCTGADTIYRRCDFLAGREYRGVAYSYGGEDPYHVFSAKIASGFLAGSHLCHYRVFGDPTPAIAGTDCSGFICHAWNFPRTSTQGLVADQKLVRIAKSELVPGDILVRPQSHSVLVAEREDSTRLLIWESTSAVNSCRQRIIDLRDTYWDSYVAVRNPQIISTPASARARHLSSAAPFAQVRAAAGYLQLDFEAPFSGSIQLRTLNGTSLRTTKVHRTTRLIIYTAALPQGLLLVDLSAEGAPRHIGSILVTR